ncbi:hypothetical protein AA536_003895 [Salmonella enterica subsp. enterica]|nr:hypothetical protein [Salmonella enterica subsp. enterica serovar Abaetetuba]
MTVDTSEVLNLADTVQTVVNQYSVDDIYSLLLSINDVFICTGLVVCFALGIIAGGQR